MFERVYLEISNICNLQCSFCPEVIRDKKILAPEDFLKFVKSSKNMTKQICLHLMGEPLAHPQFSEIMKICDDEGIRIFLTTNATLLKKHSERLLNWKALDQINFSVHSYFANPSKLSLTEYLDPILSFSRDALENKRSFYVNLRLWNLPRTSAQHEQNSCVFEIIESYFGIKIDSDVDVTKNKSKKIKDRLYLHFDTEFVWPSLNERLGSEKGSCYGLRKQVAVHANGDVVPCCLDKEAVLKLGNLHEESMEKILNSSRAKTIKQGFEKGILTEELCRKCRYADRFKDLKEVDNV